MQTRRPPLRRKYSHGNFGTLGQIHNRRNDRGEEQDAHHSTTGTPAHPEYPSAHSSMSGAAAFILAAAFGENTDFSLTSEVRPGTRSFHNFSDAVAEIADARVFAGIHFRTSCVRANTLGRSVADYVSRHAMRAPGDDQDDEKD